MESILTMKAIEFSSDFYPLLLIFSMVLMFACKSVSSTPDDSTSTSKRTGAFYSGHYPNLFVELLHKDKSEVQARIETAWNQLFYGNDLSQRVYYPVNPDMGYIKTTSDNDVRSEGMSYGMMIAVQLDKKAEFDRMWKWAKTVMQHASGSRQGYFSWRVRPDGTVMDPNPAPDGEEWIVMALFFASARWGNGTGIYDYKNEALSILEAMLNKAEQSEDNTTVTNMFDKSEKQIVFVPLGDASRFTDHSYHLPHFYELWARWSGNQFWTDAAAVSRQFLKKTANPKTGLFPDYAGFDGSPVNLFWTGRHNDFRFDAWRVGMNIAVDHLWFATDDWAVVQNNRMLDFFYKEGLKTYGNQYTLDGKRLSDDHSPGLTAMNAVAALASTNENRVDFVRELWKIPIPNGIYRYYDGMLYMLGLLQVSGNFRIYEPPNTPVPAH